MSDTPVVPLPDSYDWGFVVGRSISAIADTVADPDRFPEARGSNGRVTFTPHTRYKKEFSAPTAFVQFEVITAKIENGILIDAQGEEGIYLISGAYKVAFTIDSGSIPGFDIMVTSYHTYNNPLDLVTAAPFVPEAGTPVTTAVIPTGAAEDQVIAWRNGRLVWVNGSVQAEAAAARAEAAATAAEEWKPEFTWSGTNLVIDGVSGPNLKGDTGDVFSAAPWLGTANLNDYTTTGVYRQTASGNVTAERNYPPVEGAIVGGTLHVTAASGGLATQMYVADQSGEIWVRAYQIGAWRGWHKIGAAADNVPDLGEQNLNDFKTTRTYRQVFTSNVAPERNYPPISGEMKAGTLHVTASSGGVGTQMYVADRAGEIWVRDWYLNTWYPWKWVGGGADADTGVPRTDMEITGRWTPNDQGDAFLQALGQHELVETREIGHSVQDRPLYSVIIGDQTKPAILVNAGAHGTEVGPPEAAWLWARSLTEAKSLMLWDVCVIVVPLQNPDNRFVARGNKNAVDLNRDWLDRSQPETQAVAGLLAEFNVVAAFDMHSFGYPRQTSLLGADQGSETVNGLSQDLYDAVFAALEVDGQPVRDYGPGLPPESLVQGVAAVDNIPALLIEIPCGGYGDWTFDVFYPPPAWQAHVGMVACDAFAQYVWRNLPAFEALKEGVA